MNKDHSGSFHAVISISPAPLRKGKGKNRDFSKTDYLRVFFLVLANQFYTFDLHTITYQHAWLFIAVVRQFCSDSLKACHLAIKTFVHAQTFDRCVSKEALAHIVGTHVRVIGLF